MQYLDKVKVLKKQENNDVWQEIYEGHIVDVTSDFARVYKPRRRDDWQTGDVSSSSSEWFAINSRRIKVKLC